MTVGHKIEYYLRTFLFSTKCLESLGSDQLKTASYNVDTTVRKDYKIFLDGLDDSTNFSKLS